MGKKHKHYDCIVAWASGEEIQYRISPCDEWCNIYDPSWDNDIEYRVKPKNKEVYFEVSYVNHAVLMKYLANDGIPNVKFSFDYSGQLVDVQMVK